MLRVTDLLRSPTPARLALALVLAACGTACGSAERAAQAREQALEAAALAGAARGAFEFTGRVRSIRPPALTVDALAIRTDRHTSITRDRQAVALGDLRAGERVALRGAILADGTRLAEEIEIGGPPEDDAAGAD